MKKLFEKITNGRYTEPFVENEKYSLLFQRGINIEQYHVYRKDQTHILTVNVYPHEKVDIITLIPWGSPEVEEVKAICKELFRDLKIYLKQKVQ